MTDDTLPPRNHNAPPDPIEEAVRGAEARAADVIDKIPGFEAMAERNKDIVMHWPADTERAEMLVSQISQLKQNVEELDRKRDLEKKRFSRIADAIHNNFIRQMDRIQTCIALLDKSLFQYQLEKSAGLKAQREEEARKQAEAHAADMARKQQAEEAERRLAQEADRRRAEAARLQREAEEAAAAALAAAKAPPKAPAPLPPSAAPAAAPVAAQTAEAAVPPPGDVDLPLLAAAMRGEPVPAAPAPSLATILDEAAEKQRKAAAALAAAEAAEQAATAAGRAATNARVAESITQQVAESAARQADVDATKLGTVRGEMGGRANLKKTWAYEIEDWPAFVQHCMKSGSLNLIEVNDSMVKMLINSARIRKMPGLRIYPVIGNVKT